MKERSPVVSVLMPVYNGERYLAAAMESILAQTFGDFEFLVIDDGSTDGSMGIAAGYARADARIRLLKNAREKGIAGALNTGIGEARGDFIARMDADDISFPERLARQVAFLRNNPEHALVGTWAEIWVETEKSFRSHRHPSSDSLLKTLLLFNNPFVHSSVMFRADVARELGGYATGRTGRFTEDYEFWSRIARVRRIANIPEFLHVYREQAGSITDRRRNSYTDSIVAISVANIESLLGERRGRVIRDIVRMYHKEFGSYETGAGETLRFAAELLMKAWGAYGFDPRGIRLYGKMFVGILKNYCQNRRFVRGHANTSHG